MNVVIPLLSTVIGAVAGAVITRFNRRKFDNLQYNFLLQNILDDVDAGYYLRNTETGLEYLSEPLCRMFRLEDAQRDFGTLSRLLGEACTNSINQAIANITSDKNPQMIVANMEGGRQVECRVSGIFDARDTLTNTLLWFRDTTGGHKAHEQMLKENRQLKRDVKQYSSILNALPAPIWMRSQDLSIRYCNMAYSMAAEEGIESKGEQETLELHPYSRAFAKAAYEAGEEKSERRHIVIDGARKYYQFTEIPIKLDNMSVGIAQDMTELEVAKEELQRHINAQSELLESITSAMAVFGPDTRLKFFNHAYVRLWGLEEAWLDTGPTYGELLEALREARRLPEQANFLQFKQQRLKLFTDFFESHEEIYYLPDGRTLRVLAIPHALGGILFAYEDVTDRLALERSYNTLIAVQKATLDNLHEGVVVFGEDGRLRLYNPKFLQMWKLEKAVLSPETHISDLVEKTRVLHFADDWEVFKQKFISYLLRREVQYRRIERTDGMVMDLVVVPLPDGATLITFHDVTDSIVVERSLRERNEALSEADRLKTEFLANVSYELRSPLTSISGFSEMLTQNYFGSLSPKQKEYVHGIHEASQRLMSIINDILDIASIEAGYMKLNISKFDINAMLQSVVSLVNERMRENNLQFQVNCPRNIGGMSADETRIRQIIFNLLSNAIKYNNPGGMVTLIAKAQKENDEIVFIVEDNGIGISTEEQKDIFNKFHRGRSTGAHKSGAGLGLSMVKSFIGLHGGHVELYSVPNKGTTISCYLPRHCLQA